MDIIVKDLKNTSLKVSGLIELEFIKENSRTSLCVSTDSLYEYFKIQIDKLNKNREQFKNELIQNIPLQIY